MGQPGMGYRPRESDLVYPNNAVPIKMCLECGTCGLLNHCK